MPTSTLILPTAAPTRTSSALSGQQIPSLVRSGHSGWVANLAWSPDGKMLASGSSYEKDRNPVQLWWAADGKLLQTLYTDETGGKFYNLAWSPDGTLLAAGAVDYKLWGRDGTEIYHYLSGTPGWALAWAPDSSAWVIGNENGQATEFDTAGKVVANLHDSVGDINSLAWSPDGRILIGGDGVTMWSADVTRPTSLSTFHNRVTSVAWSPDGAMFAVGFDSNYARGAAVSDHAVGIWSSNGKSWRS